MRRCRDGSSRVYLRIKIMLGPLKAIAIFLLVFLALEEFARGEPKSEIKDFLSSQSTSNELNKYLLMISGMTFDAETKTLQIDKLSQNANLGISISKQVNAQNNEQYWGALILTIAVE